MTRTNRWWGCLVVAALALVACNDGDRQVAASGSQDGHSAASSRTQEVEYTPARLDEFQHAALSEFALSRRSRSNGFVPDVAMVISPQPDDLPAGKVLVGVRYGECGHTLGRATITEGILVVEVKPPPAGASGTVCGGMVVSEGILVTLPPNTTISDTRVEPAPSA